MVLKERIKKSLNRYWIAFLTGSVSFCIGSLLQAQIPQTNISDSATIDDCVKYAMHNQPLVRQLKLDEEISNQNIRIALSDWLPQVNTTAGFSII